MGYKGTRVPLFYRGNCKGDYLDIILYIFFIIEREHSDLAGIDRDYPGFVTPDRCALLIWHGPVVCPLLFFGYLNGYTCGARVCSCVLSGSVHLIPRLLASYGILRADRGEKQSSFHALQALWFLTASYLYKMEFSYSKSPFCDLFFSSTSTTWTWVPILQMVKNGPT